MPSERRSRLGLVAGGGDYPARLASAARAAGREVFVVALEGEATDIEADARVQLGQVGTLFSILKKAGCRDITLAGYVSRPDLRSLKLDWMGMRLLPRIAPRLRGGDDALLRVVAGVFEEHGFRVLGPEDLGVSLGVAEGVLTRTAPTQEDQEDIARAHTILEALAPLDVGQAVVVARGIVLGIETIEGTDALLRRCATLPDAVRTGGAAGPGGVLVKAAKTHQDRRLDLPVIGVETVERAAAAGLAGIAVRADDTLVLDRDGVISAADDAGLFLVAYRPENLPKGTGGGD